MIRSLALLLPAGAAAFDLSLLEIKKAESGALQYSHDGKRISPWHDIPFSTGTAEDGSTLLSFVCEIPRGTAAKMEIHKSVPYNDVVQDVTKKGEPRFYKYPVDKPASAVNYGAIAQTWEDPNIPDEDTGFGGDNDPIDVLQLNEGACSPGAVQRVRVLGGLALVDDDETDWKLLVIDVDAADAPDWKDVGDIPKEKVDAAREWFRNYKVPEGKGQNKFGLDERAVDAAHALRVAKHTHEFWQGAVDGTAKCDFKKAPCWLGGASAKEEL